MFLMKSEQLFDACFRTDTIIEGDLFPIGGGGCFSSNMLWKIRIDMDSFYHRFEATVSKQAEDTDSRQLTRDWLNEKAPEVDIDLLLILQDFTKAFEGKRVRLKLNETTRNRIYDEAEENTVNLSKVFLENEALCSEISLLAKRFLDSRDIDSDVFFGKMHQIFDPNEGMPVPDSHTFLVIKHKGEEFIFDPTSPHHLPEGMPYLRLSKPCVDFSELEAEFKTKPALVASQDVITDRVIHYGVGYGAGNALPEDFIHSKRSHDLGNRGDFGIP